ncbi:MAG: phosphopantothenoylcysteine decarboxylase [Clostridia bacterium]|nr:phosphopantothenoylcysteine decarboxylase [Clostridia bacterium]
MKKQNIIITAGGTSEPIDKVREITNSSTGKLGMTIANEILNTNEHIENLYYICSKGAFRPIHDKVKIIEIHDTMDLKKAVERLLTTKTIDYFIHSMAVSDYMVDHVTNANLLAETIQESENQDITSVIKNNPRKVFGNKISSKEDHLIIMLKPTPKIISLIKNLSPHTFLVGFKLLDGVSDEELIHVAKGIRNKNNCNLVVANDLENIKNGNHKAFIIDNNDEIITANGKEDIAKKLVRKMFYDQIQ